MNHYVKNQKGVTLVELLATLTIFSIVMAAIYGAWTFGVKAYNRTAIEGQLRDEADYIMTTIMNELYDLNPQEVGTKWLSQDESVDFTTTSISKKLFESGKTTYFTSTQKYGLNENTELVSGSQLKTRLFIIFKDDRENNINEVVLYKEQQEVSENGEIVYTPIYGEEGKVINNNKIYVLLEDSNPVSYQAIGMNNHFAININLILQPKRYYLDNSDLHKLELQSKFSL